MEAKKAPNSPVFYEQVGTSSVWLEDIGHVEERSEVKVVEICDTLQYNENI